MNKFSRRRFIKKSGLSAVSLFAASSLARSEEYEKSPSGGEYMGDFAAPKLDLIRIAIIGVGGRGFGHAKQLASIEGTEIVAISDLHEYLVDRSVTACINNGNGRHQNITRYYGDENQWKKIFAEVKPNVVIIATNWLNHAKWQLSS